MTGFQEWLLKHDEKLKTYTNQEIYNLATACGFGREEILKGVPNV